LYEATLRTAVERASEEKVSRCPACKAAIWSQYPGSGLKFYYVRVGTLENPDACPPDIHIFTESKQPWVNLIGDTPVVAQFYDRNEMWPEESTKRRDAALG